MIYSVHFLNAQQTDHNPRRMSRLKYTQRRWRLSTRIGTCGDKTRVNAILLCMAVGLKSDLLHRFRFDFDG
jgi:hypothetical protein